MYRSILQYIMVREFTNGRGDWSYIPGQVIPKTQKLNLMPPCFKCSIIWNGSRVCGAIQGKE